MSRMSDDELIDEMRQRFDFNRNALSDLRAVTRKLEEMNEKLQESERVKGQFLSNIRNEINNPLSAIMGLAGQLGACRQDPERCAKTAAIYAEAFDLDFQLQNIFMAAELEAARQSLQRTLDGAAADGAAAGSLMPILPLRPFKGDLDWPVAGTVVGTFGRQVDRRFHTATVSNSVRIAAPAAAPVAAIHEGLVVFASTFAGFGKLVIVDHGSAAFLLYGYLADIDVTSGERVAKSQVLGSVGTGLSGDPGLYFELRIDGKPVDPLQWLRRH